MRIEDGDVVVVNGQPMQFVDATMIEMGYYPVWKHMSKWGRRQHRRNSAVNVVKRARKLRSRKRQVQRFVYRWLLDNMTVIPRDREIQVKLVQGLEVALRERFPSLMKQFEVSV